MGALVDRLAGALDAAGIAFCAWKGEAALARALRGERDLDGLVRAADFVRALDVIESEGWKRAVPLRGRDEPGTAHFFGFEPSQTKLLHLHLHDRILSGEDWINSHVLPFAEDFLTSPRRAHGLRVPGPGGEAALAVLKHALRWGSWPDRATSWLRPKDEAAELAALLTPAALADAEALVASRCPALDRATFRACAEALLAPPSGERARLARRVRLALRGAARFDAGSRARAYLGVATARLRRALDGERQNRSLAHGPVRISLEGASEAELDTLAGWLGAAFHVARASAPPQLCVGAGGGGEGARAVSLVSRGGGEAALRAAIWNAL